MRELDRGLRRAYDGTSACLTTSLACLAKSQGFSRIDSVHLSEATATQRAGENVFIVQGGLNDPGNRVAWMRTQDALSVPVDQSLQRMAQLDAARTAPEPAFAQRHVEPQPVLRIA